MRGIISIFLIIAFNIQAEDCRSLYTFTIEGNNKELCLLEDSRILVSQNCKSKKCKAVEVINSMKEKEIDLPSRELTGGKNPSTLLCKKLNGTLRLGISSLGHHQFFCQFEDESIVSTASLYQKFQQ